MGETTPATQADYAGECAGRERELERILDSLRAGGPGGRVVAVTGAAGAGKSALLTAAAAALTEAGVQMLRSPVGSARPPALGELLAPLAGRVDSLGEVQRTALKTVLALDSLDGEGVERFGPAVGALLASSLRASGDAAAADGVVVVLDDADHMDNASVEVLAFVCRRARVWGIDFLIAAEAPSFAALLGVDTVQVALSPLGEAAAHRLLDRLTKVPGGPARRTLLIQAEGDRAALLDLGRAIASMPDGARWPEQDPLPCSAAARDSCSEVLAGMDEADRKALVLAAAAGTRDLAAATGSGALEIAPEVWGRSEAAGLVRLSGDGVGFVRPLVRSAIYHGASPAARQAAHAALADALARYPDRAAWHRAKAVASGTYDQDIAVALEQSSEAAAMRSGPTGAAFALERAAQLAADPAERARLLTRAAVRAEAAGDTDWAKRLATAAAGNAVDPTARAAALTRAGWLLTWSGAHDEAVRTQLPLVRAHAVDRPALAASALASAAVSAYHSGLARHRGEVVEALGLFGSPGAAPTPARPGPEGRGMPGPGDTSDSVDFVHHEISLLFGRVMVEPFRERAVRLAELVAAREAGQESAAGLLGTVAWILDDSVNAADLLHRMLPEFSAVSANGPVGARLASAAWADLDVGRWQLADDLARRLVKGGVAGRPDLAVASGHAVAAMLAAYRGDESVHEHAAAAESMLDEPSRDFAVHLARARAIAALGSGDGESAYSVLHGVLRSADGGLLHFHLSLYGLADFAAAAVSADRSVEARVCAERALRTADDSLSPRLSRIVAHAMALLGTDEQAIEASFEAAVAPGGETWPFESARARLSYGEWLRRRYRPEEARRQLAEAQDVFARLGAEPWSTRAAAELRAARTIRSDVDPAARELRINAWSALSTHQRQILRLAAEGLSNREIGEQLVLSHRTVGSHLYRAFPALGISTRAQLRDLIAEVDQADGRGA